MHVGIIAEIEGGITFSDETYRKRDCALFSPMAPCTLGMTNERTSPGVCATVFLPCFGPTPSTD